MWGHCCGHSARGCWCLLPVTSCPNRPCPVPTNPPLSESFALSVSSSLKVFLQAPPLCLQSLHLSSSPFSGADKSHFFQELLLLINEDQTVPLRVQHARPGLAVKLSQLDFQVCYSAGGKKMQLFPEECLTSCSRHAEVHHDQPHLPEPWGRLSTWSSQLQDKHPHVPLTRMVPSAGMWTCRMGF